MIPQSNLTDIFRKMESGTLTSSDILSRPDNYFGILGDEFWCAIWLKGKATLLMYPLYVTGNINGKLYHHYEFYNFIYDNSSSRMDFQIDIRKSIYKQMSITELQMTYPELVEKLKIIVTISNLSI